VKKGPGSDSESAGGVVDASESEPGATSCARLHAHNPIINIMNIPIDSLRFILVSLFDLSIILRGLEFFGDCVAKKLKEKLFNKSCFGRLALD
jgi:hypothetical protein